MCAENTWFLFIFYFAKEPADVYTDSWELRPLALCSKARARLYFCLTTLGMLLPGVCDHFATLFFGTLHVVTEGQAASHYLLHICGVKPSVSKTEKPKFLFSPGFSLLFWGGLPFPMWKKAGVVWSKDGWKREGQKTEAAVLPICHCLRCIHY